jgi:hypothetical protein
VFAAKRRFPPKAGHSDRREFDMTPRPLVLALAAALALPLSAHAANYTYHGDLIDGDAPAEGAYDLRVRSFANPGDVKSLGEATELPGVKLSGGRFSIEVDLPEDVDGTSWVEVAVRKAGSGEDYVALGDPQPLSKVNSTCPGAWALDGNSGAPVGSYLGFADDRAVFVNAPRGVALNSTTEPVSSIDLSVHAKSGGDADADVAWVSRSNKNAGIYLSDSNGTFVQYAQSGGFSFLDGVSTATQNNGLETFNFSGRLRVGAAGEDPGDTSGGIWFDDERSRASFMGRGDNQSNWTGVFTNPGGWRFTAHDNGAFGFNTGTEALPANQFKVNAQRPLFNTGAYVPFSTDSFIIGNLTGGFSQYTNLVLLGQRGGFNATTYLGMSTDSVSDPADFYIDVAGPGGLTLNSISLRDRVGIMRASASNALEVEGNASKTTAGSWLANSDRRIKTDIEPIPNALDTIMKLRPVTFRYDDAYRTSHKGIDPTRYHNVIAQEFAEVFPDAVKGSGEYLPGQPKSKDNEILQVDTYPAQITAIAAIQELAVQNDALREQLATLSARLERLERNAKEQ